MAQTVLSHCDCCGLAVDLAEVEVCPNCQYPVDPEDEQHFLETSIHDLGRVMRYGGASITVANLVRRYEGRLQLLLHLKAQPAGSFSTAPSIPVDIPLQPAGRGQESPGVNPVWDLPNPPAQVAGSTRGFSFSSDALINLVATLGGFLILAGSLSFVLTTSSLWLSFAAVFLLHAAFGGAGAFTRRRFPLLRAVSTLYTLIFVLLVPLVGFSAYRLTTNGLVELSTPQLLMLASLYAAVTYNLLAVVQRFALFAYLGIVALLVADLALAQTLRLAYWWWPCVIMLLSLVGLITVPDAPATNWFFTGEREILRVPWLVLTYVVVWVIIPLAFLIILGSSLLLDMQGQPVQGMHLALLCLSCLVFVWSTLWIWRTSRIKGTPLLAYLLLGTFLLLGYKLNLDRTGYVVLLASVVLVYHVLVRVIGTRLASYGFPRLTLDQLAIGLSVLVMLLVAFATPFQLLYRAYADSPAQSALSSLVGFIVSLSFVSHAGDAFDLLALGVCLLVTIDITLTRAGLSRTPARAGWCWLLLLGGFLLAAIYSLVVLLRNVNPLGAFMTLSLALLVCAILARRFASPAWANPLDILVLCAVGFTLALSFSQPPEVTSAFLFGLAALFYIVLLYQRRPRWCWLVTIFACWSVLLAQSLTLPFVLGIGASMAVLGLLSERVFHSAPIATGTSRFQSLSIFTWSWPWYSAFLASALVLGTWNSAHGPGLVVPGMLVFTLLALAVMLIERAPEVLIFPAGLAAWTISLWLPSNEPALSILAYTILCALIFAAQFIWRQLPAATRWLPETSLHNILSLGGLCLVLLDAFGQGALSPGVGWLAQSGVLALVMLSLLLFLYGLAHPSSVMRALPQNMDELKRADRLEAARSVRHGCYYTAGLLFSLVASWEMLAFHQTRFDVLTVIPASYLIVLAPFLLHDQALHGRHTVGQLAALVGSALLFLPALWFSLNGTDLLPTLILLGESLVLLLLGLGIRLRVFILSSAALVIIGTLRLLFLSIPSSVPVLLMIFGSLLIALATALILSRHRLQAAWGRWE